MHRHRHVPEDHRRSDQRSRHRAETEAGVEARHDRTAQQLLDEGSVHVHRHVPRPGGEPHHHEADHHHGHSDLVADADRRHSHAEQAGHGGDDPARAEASDERSRDRERHERSGGHGEKNQPECRRIEPQLIANLGDARRPRGHRHSRAAERHVRRRHRLADSIVARGRLDAGGNRHRACCRVVSPLTIQEHRGRRYAAASLHQSRSNREHGRRKNT